MIIFNYFSWSISQENTKESISSILAGMIYTRQVIFIIFLINL